MGRDIGVDVGDCTGVGAEVGREEEKRRKRSKEAAEELKRWLLGKPMCNIGVRLPRFENSPR